MSKNSNRFKNLIIKIKKRDKKKKRKTPQNCKIQCRGQKFMTTTRTTKKM